MSVGRLARAWWPPGRLPALEDLFERLQARATDEAVAEILRRYAAHHLLPRVEHFGAQLRIVNSLGEIGGSAVTNEGQFTLPAAEIAAGLEAGLFVECAEHGAPEIADGVTPEMIEVFVRRRQSQE